MQLRPTFLLWMQPDRKVPAVDRLCAEPFRGREHIFLESAEAWCQDPHLDQKILGVLGKTGNEFSGIAIVHVWNLTDAPPLFLSDCIRTLQIIHDRLDNFLKLNANLYPQLQNRLCQLILRLPRLGQAVSPEEQQNWIQELRKASMGRLSVDRVIVVGNSNTDPSYHEAGLTVQDSQVETHLMETMVALVESSVDKELRALEKQGDLLFWSAGCGRVVVDLRNAADYAAHVHGARLLNAYLRQDGQVPPVEVTEGEIAALKLDPMDVAQNLLEGKDPRRTSCLGQMQISLPPVEPQDLEKPGGADVPAVFFTQAMMELSENLGGAHDRMQENRHALTAQVAKALFKKMGELQAEKCLYWGQSREWLDKVQDINQRKKGEYPLVVQNLPQIAGILSEEPDASSSEEKLSQTALLSQKPGAPPDPFGAFRDLRAQVRVRKYAPSVLARWTLGVTPLAFSLGAALKTQNIAWPLALFAVAGVILLGLLAGVVQLHREKNLRAKAFWRLRHTVRDYARYRLWELLRDQGFKHYDNLHTVMGEPEETASRKVLEPEKAFGRHALNPEMKPILEQSLHERLLAVKSEMETVAERLQQYVFVPVWPSNPWLCLFFDEEILGDFPFFPLGPDGRFTGLNLEQVPDEKMQLALCLKPAPKEDAGCIATFWENRDVTTFEAQWVERIREQGYQYFNKAPLHVLVDFVHSQRPEYIRKVKNFLDKTAHPYFRLSLSGPAFHEFHFVSPSDPGMQKSSAIQQWTLAGSRELPWDGWPGVGRLRLEGPVDIGNMHVLPISSLPPNTQPVLVQPDNISTV